jgi:hypothetical protein
MLWFFLVGVLTTEKKVQKQNLEESLLGLFCHPISHCALLEPRNKLKQGDRIFNLGFFDRGRLSNFFSHPYRVIKFIDFLDTSQMNW